LLSNPDCARTNQLAALLGPDSFTPRPDKRGPGGPIVVVRSHKGRIAVAGERDGPALLRISHGAGSNQLLPLLRKLRWQYWSFICG
jgi:hypothetical protein